MALREHPVTQSDRVFLQVRYDPERAHSNELAEAIKNHHEIIKFSYWEKVKTCFMSNSMKQILFLAIYQPEINKKWFDPDARQFESVTEPQKYSVHAVLDWRTFVFD
jgi:hypothetical protein